MNVGETKRGVSVSQPTPLANGNVAPAGQEREDLIHRLDSALETRGSVLRKVSEMESWPPGKEFCVRPDAILRNPNEGPDSELERLQLLAP